MIELNDVSEFEQYVGKSLGVSAWLEVTQDIISSFADTTGDDQWIHVDVERAKRESPGGKTIAHGYLLLSFIPVLNRGIYVVHGRRRALNYGLNKVRFLSQVQAGDRVRLNQAVKSVEPGKGGVLVTYTATLEIEGSERPAVIAEPVTLFQSG